MTLIVNTDQKSIIFSNIKKTPKNNQKRYFISFENFYEKREIYFVLYQITREYRIFILFTRENDSIIKIILNVNVEKYFDTRRKDTFLHISSGKSIRLVR